MIGRSLSYLFCLRKLKFTPYLEKKRVSTTCEQKYEILVGLSICLGNIWNMFQISGEGCPPLVGKANYDRPFMDHIGWEKENILLKNVCNKYDWLFGKNYIEIEVNHDRPRSNTPPATNLRIYRKEKEGNFRF